MRPFADAKGGNDLSKIFDPWGVICCNPEIYGPKNSVFLAMIFGDILKFFFG